LKLPKIKICVNSKPILEECVGIPNEDDDKFVGVFKNSTYQSFMRFFLKIPYGSVFGVFFRLVRAIQKEKLCSLFLKESSWIVGVLETRKITLIFV
jgi:hypothetical protein